MCVYFGHANQPAQPQADGPDLPRLGDGTRKPVSEGVLVMGADAARYLHPAGDATGALLMTRLFLVAAAVPYTMIAALALLTYGPHTP